MKKGVSITRLVMIGLVCFIGYAPVFAQTPQKISLSNVVDAGRGFFGTASAGIAGAIEKAVQRYGLPNGYIIGEEGGFAIFGGLRYGSGVLTTKNVGQHKVYWQGPSIGYDFGADGSRLMILVYNLPSVDALYSRFIGVKGTVYVVGGFGFTLLSNTKMFIVPIATGVGARLGVNIGYMKFTRQLTINPF